MAKRESNIELRSEEVQDIITRVPNWIIRRGSFVLFLISLSILLGSWFIRYPNVIASKAIIMTSTPPYKEYANSTGEINTILVKNNEFVEKNEVLAVIESSAQLEDVMKLKLVVEKLTVSKNIPLDVPIEDYTSLSLGQIEKDYSEFEKNYFDFRLNQELKPSKYVLLRKKKSLEGYDLRLKKLFIQMNIHQSELKLRKVDYERNKQLHEKDIISAQEFEKKEIEYLTAQRNYQETDIEISRIEEEISKLKSEIQLQKIDQVKDEHFLEMELMRSLNQLKKSIKEWELQYLLKSKIDGKITFLNYWKENQSVLKGDHVFTVVPIEGDKYVAKLKTPPHNAGKISIGQQVNIMLDSYPQEEYGIINGEISSISLVPDQNGFYSIDVDLDVESSSNDRIKSQQEMRGTAFIITEDSRLLERLFYRLRDISERN